MLVRLTSEWTGRPASDHNRSRFSYPLVRSTGRHEACQVFQVRCGLVERCVMHHTRGSHFLRGHTTDLGRRLSSVPSFDVNGASEHPRVRINPIYSICYQ